MKNTEITFTYRDGANYKNESGPYILEGSFTPAEAKDLHLNYAEADSLLIPQQISSAFLNACPSLKGLSNTNNGSYDESYDHPYHGLIIEETGEEVNCKMSAKEFYAKVKNTNFDEFDY